MKATGELVGTTSSGKPVRAFLRVEALEFLHPSTIDFMLLDHYEALAIFDYLTIRAKRRQGEFSEDYYRYSRHAEYHENFPGLREQRDDLRSAAGVTDVFGDQKLGHTLCRPEFRD